MNTATARTNDENAPFDLETSVYPTLVVGLGGTGCKIAKRIKRTMHDENAQALNIHFMGFDTDTRESGISDPSELPLDSFVRIGGEAIHFDPQDRTNQPILSWLPTDRQGNLTVNVNHLSSGQGAGGKRLIGRFGYNYFAPQRFRSIQLAIDKLADLGRNPLAHSYGGRQFSYRQGLAIYVVGSLVGGTGSGIFLDVLATLHRLTERALGDRQRFFFGLFLLPSVFEYRAINSQSQDHKATAYACLKDLDLLLSRDDESLRTFWYYNEPEPRPVNKRLLDACFLVGRYSGSGALVRDEDVYDLAATYLYSAIGTPLGSTSDSIANNSHKTDLEDPSGGRCNYSSFGVAGLDYSQKLMLRYFSARLAADTMESLIGQDIGADAAQKLAVAEMERLGLGIANGPENYVKGGVGATYEHEDNEFEDMKPADFHRELTEGYKEFKLALEPGGSLLASLQSNLRNHLISRPSPVEESRDRSSFTAAEQPQMWLHQTDTLIENTVSERGLRSGKRVAEAMAVHLERANAEIDRKLQSVEAEVTQLERAYTDAMNELHSFTAVTSFFMRGAVKEAKREAIRNRNLAVSRRVTLEALRLSRSVFMDPTNGLLARVRERIERIRQTLDAADAAQMKLSEETGRIERGDESASALSAAPDRSVLLYDVVSASRFPEMFAGQPDHVEALKAALIGEDSLLKLLDSIRESDTAQALRDRALRMAEGYYVEATNRHILDVLTDGANTPEERVEKLRDAVRRVAPNLSPNLPTRARRGDGSTYDYCVVLYPHHPDSSLTDAFERVAMDVFSQERGVTVQAVADEGPKNRILMTYMQHGIPLNANAFPEIREWMRAYEILKGRNAAVDVDKRWMKYPGPEQRDTGDTREKLFALGLAYGLIAQQGDFYYVNFHPSLIRLDPTHPETREQAEVDLEKVQAELQKARSPLEWFKHLTLGPSATDTIPGQFGEGLGAGKKRDRRDCIGQGRAAALKAFVENEGEDYADVANGITAVLAAYVEERGKSAVRDELAWYVGRLQEEMTRSTQLKDQFERELFLVTHALESLEEEGDFGLPDPVA